MNKTIEEMNKEVFEFYKNGTTKQRDELEYMICLQNEHYGWIKLSSGNEVYIAEPRLSAEKIGEGMRLILDRIK